jgi:membrane protein DedA with SNARE-associated domain
MLDASVVSFLIGELHKLPSALVYVVVGLLVFGEAALFVGFVLPGETTVLVAGVIASQGGVNIVALVGLVIAAAIVGDTVGYVVGREFGPRLLDIGMVRPHRERLDKAMLALHKRGATYVFLARFSAFLRAVMPGLAGMSRMHYTRFLIANAIGGLVWGGGFTMLGYLGGKQLPRIEKYASYFSWGVLALILTVLTSLVVRHQLKKRSGATPH